jgi:hypothetical protein
MFGNLMEFAGPYFEILLEIDGSEFLGICWNLMGLIFLDFDEILWTCFFGNLIEFDGSDFLGI